MLNAQRQNILFDKIIEILDNAEYKFKDTPPILDFNYVKKEKPGDKEILFEFLGYFDSSNPERVFLCPDLINKYSDAELVEEIVYIHEVAHYLHYHIREAHGKDFIFLANTNENKEKRKIIVESFAQLITHKVCLGLSAEHYKIFEKLQEGQSIEYTYYNRNRNTGPNFSKEFVNAVKGNKSISIKAEDTIDNFAPPYSSYSLVALLETFIKFDTDSNDNLDQYLFKINEREIKKINGIKENSISTDTLFFNHTDDLIFKQPTPFI